MGRWLLGASLLAGLSIGPRAGAQECAGHAVVALETNGPAENRIDLLFRGWGYVGQAEQDFFRQVVTQKIIPEAFGVEPYKTYRKAINLYIAWTCLPKDDPNIWAEAAAILDAAPYIDVVCDVVNCNTDCGLPAHVEAPVTGSGRADPTNLFLHEVGGHLIGRVVDEYPVSQPRPAWEGVNATTQTARENIPWNAWIDSNTPLPTPWDYVFPPGSTEVGLVPIGGDAIPAMYRPQRECVMDSPWQTREYCRVCRESIILSIQQQMSLMDIVKPATSAVVTSWGQTVPFQVAPVFDRGAYATTWKVDGVTQLAGPGEYVFTHTFTERRIYRIDAEVTDNPTPMVRRPFPVHRRTWMVSVESMPPYYARLGAGTSFLQARTVDYGGDPLLEVGGLGDGVLTFLRRNLGGGAFDDVTPPLESYSKLESGDWDSDGNTDFLLQDYSTGKLKLTLNRGGALDAPRDIAGLDDRRGFPTLADMDGDGRLDVIAEMGGEVGIYRQQADGSCVGTNLGQPNPGYAVPADYDGDGDLDFLLVPVVPERMFMLRNDGMGLFAVDLALTSLLPQDVSFSHATWADLDNDGDLDLVVSSYQGARLLLNDPLSGFAAADAPLGVTGAMCTGDMDNDGDLDLLVGGTVYRNELRETGSLSFTLVGATNGGMFLDFDNDGDLDIYGGTRWRNEASAGNFVDLRLRGTVSNGSAFGARVVAEALDGAGNPVFTQTREVWDDAPAHFGFGTHAGAVRVTVTWPNPARSTKVMTWRSPPNARYTVVESQPALPPEVVSLNPSWDWVTLRCVRTDSDAMACRPMHLESGQIVWVSDPNVPFAPDGTAEVRLYPQRKLWRDPVTSQEDRSRYKAQPLVYLSLRSVGAGGGSPPTVLGGYLLVRGDADYTGRIDGSDVVYMSNYLYKGGPAPITRINGDADSSKAIGIADLMYLSNFVYRGGPAPVQCNE